MTLKSEILRMHVRATRLSVYACVFVGAPSFVHVHRTAVANARPSGRNVLRDGVQDVPDEQRDGAAEDRHEVQPVGPSHRVVRARQTHAPHCK